MFNIDILINAIYGVESSYGRNPNINKEDRFTSLGPLQITRNLLDDVNRIISLKKLNIELFSYNERLLLDKSIRIAKIYFDYYTKVYKVELNYINLSRMWNGGPKAYLIQKDSKKEQKLKDYTSKILKLIDSE